MQDAFCARELAPLLGKTRQSIEEWAGRHGWRYRETPGRGRGGRVKLWLLSSMDEPTRLALSIRRQRDALAAQESPARAPACAAPAPETPPAKLRKAALRADLVLKYLAAKRLAKRRGAPLDAARRGFVTLYNAGASYPAILAELGPTSEKTLERWAVTLRLRGHDCAALVSRAGEHRRGVSKVTEPEKDVLLKLLLHQNRIKTGTAIGMAKTHLAATGVPSPSSPGTLRKFVHDFKALHADIWTLAREGEKALIDKILPSFTRDASLLQVGDVLVADGHRCNFTVSHPFTGKPARPTLVAFQDWASRDIAGYAYMLEEDAQTIHLALYRAILRLGKPPRAVYLDNGKGFKAKVFTGLDIEQSGLCGLYARLGIRAVFAAPYNARAKVIEPFFKTMGDQFERFLPSFCGASPADKPARLRRNEAFMRRLAPSAPVTLEQAAQAFDVWLDRAYRARPHSGLKGRAPGDVFQAGRGPGVDPANLRFLMMHQEIAQLTNSGISRFGRRYTHDALYGLRCRVLIRYDWHDLSRVHVYTPDGAHICDATPAQAVHPMLCLAENPDYAAFREQKRARDALKRDTKRLVARLAGPGPTELLPLPEAPDDATPPQNDDALLDPTALDWLDGDGEPGGAAPWTPAGGNDSPRTPSIRPGRQGRPRPIPAGSL